MERRDSVDVNAQARGRTPDVLVFNPFAEGYIARGPGFAPVKHQVQLAADLANLPQFLGHAGDIVLVEKRPSAEFLRGLEHAGFPSPEFVELKRGRIDETSAVCQQELGRLRPWAWGPDSVQLLELLFARVTGDARTAAQCFNDNLARLYSKAWSAEFLRKVLARCRANDSSPALPSSEPWLCTEREAGVAVDTLDGALEAIARIRDGGHHRVVAKEAHGLAGHNAIRLWEPELLPTQRQWLANAVQKGRQLVIEPWLERELDYSIQLEMGPRHLELLGYTGLINDRKGQFMGNWAAADHVRRPPPEVTAQFDRPAEMGGQLERFYAEITGWLEVELLRAGFIGPVSIDAFVYRTPEGGCRLKPIVEINPRHTMGRLTLELMRQACPGSRGVFRLVSRARARAEGCPDFASYARAQSDRRPLRLEGESGARIREGLVCLNDPATAQVCLATFEAGQELFCPP